ncbi:MAG: hypothetical protein R6W76_21350 [Caldilinea sp.]
MNPKVTSPIDLPVLPELPAGPPEEVTLRRRLLEILLAPSAPGVMSYEEFLDWANEATMNQAPKSDTVCMERCIK